LSTAKNLILADRRRKKMKTALLIGGAGPTGPHVAKGLVDRGYELTLMNRGLHTAPGLPPHELIKADPHFRETIDEALKGKSFDLIVAAYGRTRFIAEAVVGKCGQFISVGGAPAYLGCLAPWKMKPYGTRLPLIETDGLADDEACAGDDHPAVRFSHLVWETEQLIMDRHASRSYSATHFRYPLIYGPRQPSPPEWTIVRRVLDGRKHVILADGGLEILCRCAARNAAEFVLLAVDHAQIAAGQIYNCADGHQWTYRQWAEEIVSVMGGDMEMFSMPSRLAIPARSLMTIMPASTHLMLDTTKARTELGYTDVVEPRSALKDVIDWLMANPIADDAYGPDSFNYAAEDRLMEAYLRAVEEVERTAPFPAPEAAHIYAHPKTPGEAMDHRGR
jgi:nucleoside-diphosphate-sugar epimerase